jgi:hypothetical protein
MTDQPFRRMARKFLRPVAPRQRRSLFRPVRLTVEPLEDRRLMAVVAPGASWSDAAYSVSVTNTGSTPFEATGGGGTVTVSPVAGQAAPAAYAMQVHGDLEWAGDASDLWVFATGSVGDIDVSGDVSVTTGAGSIGAITGADVSASASASGASIGDVTATGDVGLVTTGGTIGDVHADGDIDSLWAEGSIGAVDAGGSIFTVSSYADVASVSAGGSIGTWSDGGGPSHRYGPNADGVTAEGAIAGSVVATAGHVSFVRVGGTIGGEVWSSPKLVDT